MLTLHSQLREPANDSIDDHIGYFESIFPHVVKASSQVVEIVDVAGTCSHKATRDIIVSTLKLKPKITNNLGHDRWPVLHITEYKPRAII